MRINIKFASVSLLLSCIVCYMACNRDTQDTPPVAYFEKTYDSINQKFGFSDSGRRFLSVLFNKYPNADPNTRFKYYGYCCAYYYTFGISNKIAMQYADSMLLLVHNHPELKDYENKDALANISKGDILFAIKEYNAAYQYYYLGKVAAEKSLDPCTYSEYSYRLGMVMYRKTSYGEAAIYFKKAFEESGSCKEDFGLFYRRQELVNNTALSYKKSGQNDSAITWYNKALDFIASREKLYPDRQAQFAIARGVVYGNIGQVYVPGDNATAEDWFKKSIAINRQRGYDINDALITQQHLATLYMDQQKWEPMRAILQEMQAGLDTIKNNLVRTEWNRLMWKYYDHQKDVPAAYTYLSQYNELKDKDAANNKKLDETDVTGQMRSLEAEYQMNLLRKDNKLNQAYFIVTAVLVGMLGIILLLILYYWRKSKRNVQMLTALNNQINKQKEQLEDTLGELEDRNKEKDRILGIVAHDLRNPIAAISSLITILEDEHEYSDDQLQVFELMQNACTNSIELINEILEFAINDNNPDDVTANEPVDINLIAGNCVKMLRFKAAEKKQKLQLSVSDTPEIIKANPAKMWRVISNLITNAVKFSPSGAVIQVRTEHKGDRVQLSVHDKGIGIPDAIKNKIFDTHTEAKRPGTQGEKPFGLGLSICKQIVETYKGEIWFETAEGQGTIFYISLPKQRDMVSAT